MTKPQPRPTDVLSALPAELSARLFSKARPVSLSADETLFLAGDAGDGCYRVDDGLLKASILSPTGGSVQHCPQATACNRAKSTRLPMINSDRCVRPCGRPTAVEAYP